MIIEMKRRYFIQTSLAAVPWVSLGNNIYSTQAYAMEQTKVINAGIGGNNTQDLLDRIQKDCLAHKPDITVLMVGANDMNTRKYIALPQYTANLDNLSQQILKSGSALILMTITPVHEPYIYTRHDQAFYGAEGHAGRKDQVNAAIRQVASKNKAALIDLHHVYSAIGHVGTDKSSWIQNEANSGNTDGLHPTPDGYRVIALAVYGKLQTYDLQGKTIVCFGDSITAGDGSPDGNSYPAHLRKLLGKG